MKKQTILKEVFEYYQTDYQTQLLNVKRRDREYVKVRHFVYLFLQDYTSLSDRQIGEIFNQDHSNIFTCANKLRGWIKSNKALKSDYEAIKANIERHKREKITFYELAECWTKRIEWLRSLKDNGYSLEYIPLKEMEQRMINIIYWAKRFNIK